MTSSERCCSARSHTTGCTIKTFGSVIFAANCYGCGVPNVQAGRPAAAPTISVIAKKLGVSRSTVSRAFTRPHLLRPETVERVLAAGIRPVHLDSHHHSHTEWAIAPLVCRLAREYNIQRIRLTRNMGHIPSRAKRIYKKLFNYWFLAGRSGLG